MPIRYPPDLFDPPPMLFLAWCAVALAVFAILIALLPGFYEHRPPHQRQAFRRVAGTSLAAMLLAACAWVLALTDHFLAFDFPFYSFRGTPLRRLLHTVAPSIVGIAFLFAFVQAYAFWRRRAAETLCGHCGYPLSNAEHTNTTCAECGTTTAQLHPIPPGFRPTTRISLANTLARFLLITAAATLGWSLIYLPHIPTKPRITTHHIQCAAPDHPAANIHLTITEHHSALPLPGASFVAYIDINVENNDATAGRTRATLLRKPFHEIRAIVEDRWYREHMGYHSDETYGAVAGGQHQFKLEGIKDNMAWLTPLSSTAWLALANVMPRHNSRDCAREAIQSQIDQLIAQHTAHQLLPAASSPTATRPAELIAAATTATLAALFTLLALTLARRRRKPLTADH